MAIVEAKEKIRGHLITAFPTTPVAVENIGAQSVSNADTVDGKHASAFATAAQGEKADAAAPASWFTSEEFLGQSEKPAKRKGNKLMQEETKTKEKDVITEERAKEIKEETSTKGKGFRGVDDSIYAYFGVRHEFNEQTGEVQAQYYPCTQDGELTGYKVREVPKDFRSIGRTGATTDCFMQFRFNRGGKYVVLTEGELDGLAAYQMLKEYNRSRGLLS